MRWHEVLPVAVSVTVIILVAVLQRQSKLVAAVAAVMPLSAPLALWIVYSANREDPAAMAEFGRDLLVGILPTLGFVIAVWLATRAGLKLIPVLVCGYGVWTVGVAIIALLRRSGGL